MSGTAQEQAIPPIPVIVGVSGHCDIHPDAMPDVESAVERALTELRDRFEDALYIMTGLADGADQIVACAANRIGIKTIAVLPFPYDDYKATIADKAKFACCWDAAKLQMTLPPVGIASTPGTNDRGYEQLGAFLSARCHLLLLLWEGPERAAASKREVRFGGTADVLDMRFEMRRAMQAQRDSDLFADSGTLLDVAHADPVLQIVTPRSDAPDGTSAKAAGLPVTGAFYLLHNTTGKSRTPVPDIKKLVALFGKEARDALQQIEALNRVFKEFPSPYKKLYETQIGYLLTPHIATPDDDRLARLKSFQAATDTASARYQRHIIGQLSASTLLEAFRKIKASIRNHTPFPRPSTLLIFMMGLPLSVVLFELHSKLELNIGFLALYLVVSGGAFILYRYRVRKERWQDRFQDYRALAEALRVQLYWTVAALPIAASDNYLRKQAGELGWIQFALRGPALWATSLALDLKIPNRAAVGEGWISDQLKFFGGVRDYVGKSEQNKHAATRNKLIASSAFLLGLGLVLVILGVHWLEPLLHDSHGCVSTLIRFLHDHARYLEVAAVTLPAVAASLTAATDLRAYEAHAHNYQQMGVIFERAQAVIKTIPIGVVAAEPDEHDRAFQDLVRELGREALSENAEWLMDHRDRSVEPSP